MLKEIVPIKDLRDQDYFRYNMSNAPPQNGARLDQQVSYLFSTFKKSFLFSTGDSLTIHSSVNFIWPKNLLKSAHLFSISLKLFDRYYPGAPKMIFLKRKKYILKKILICNFFHS